MDRFITKINGSDVAHTLGVYRECFAALRGLQTTDVDPTNIPCGDPPR